jgi:hypothetical protein
MTDDRAAGYAFGFHDSFLQRCGFLEPIKPVADFDIMQASYQRIFGDKAGLALLEMSLSLQDQLPFFRFQLESWTAQSEIRGRRLKAVL